MAAVVEAVKELVKAEQKTCVQCGKSYSEDTNGEGHCAFHTGSYDSWKRRYSCCGQAEPCQRKKHRDKHHCEYPYEKFFARSSAILNYVDTTDQWASIEEEDLEGGSTEKVSVGQLLRWKSKGQLVKDQNLLVVRVGASIWPGSKYFFHVFSETDLDEIGKSGKKEIFRSNETSDKYSKAEWIIDDQMIVGIVLEAKAPSNDVPSIEKLMFSSFPLKKGTHEVVQKGGIQESKPADVYILPEESANTDSLVDLSQVKQRKARDDFKTLDAATKKGMITIDMPDAMKCNQNGVETGFDRFMFHLSITNASSNPVMLMKLNVEFKLLNEREWHQLGSDALDYSRTHRGNPLPMKAPEADRAEIAGVVRVPHVFGNNDAQAKPEHKGNFYRSYIARHTPIRFRFTFGTPNDGFVSKVFEYVEPVDRFKFEEKKDKDVLFLFLDDADLIDRKYIHVATEEDPYGYGKLMQIDGKEFKKLDAQKCVYEALKTKNTEIRLTDWEKNKNEIEKRIFALVDTECQSVYAIKVQLIDTNTGIAKQGYAPVRYYGDEDATAKPVKPATESAELPPAGSVTVFDFNDEDEKVDDLTEEDLTFEDDDDEDTGSGGGGGANVNLKRVEAKLDSLNQNVDRIANALEQLVALMAAKK